MRPSVCQRVRVLCSSLQLLIEVPDIVYQISSSSTEQHAFILAQANSELESSCAAAHRASKSLPRGSRRYKPETTLRRRANFLWAVGWQSRHPDIRSAKSRQGSTSAEPRKGEYTRAR